MTTLIAGVGAGAEAAKPITATDLLHIRAITDVRVARDGSFAVYAVRSVHTEKPGEKYAYRTHLWMARLDADRGAPMQLTHGAREDGSFDISPDGRTLAFVRRGESSGGDEKDKPKGQVWLLPLDGPGEARQLTTLEHGASSAQWLGEGGGSLLVSSSIPMRAIEGAPEWDNERPRREWRDHDFEVEKPKGESGDASPDDAADDAPPAGKADARPDGDRRAIRNWLERNASKDNPAVINRIAFQDELSLKGEASFGHLFVVDAATGEARQITEGFRDHGSPAASPDGGTIVFVDTPRTGEHPDRFSWRANGLYSVGADGTGLRELVPAGEWIIGSPRFTPDGRYVICTAAEGDEPAFRQSKVARVDARTGHLDILTSAWDSHANSPVPASTGEVLFSTPHQGSAPLMRVAMRGGAADRLTDGPNGVMAFDEGGGRIVAAVTQASNPCELYLVDGDQMRVLSAHNSGWLAEREVSAPREHWVQRPDGSRVQYWVMAPTREGAGGKRPTALEMHGGPMAMWGPGEFSMWHEFQLLCAWGYGVVYSNPRGSSGYGYDFQKANYQDWGFGPMGDVLAALEDAARIYSWIDTDRLFLTGGSYAGYLTAWIIGHDQRFKAAVAQRGVYHLPTFFGEGNAWRLNEEAMGGFPWDEEARRIMERESPFNYAQDMTTPLLIVHASNDLRTGVSQSEMLYRALKELRREVEYVRYPGAGHDLSRNGDPRQRMDRLNRIVEFFERYSGNDLPAPTHRTDSTPTQTPTGGAR